MFTDMFFDQYYLEGLEEGKQLEMPHVFRIAKGNWNPSD